MGEKYPFYSPHYVVPDRRRSMRQIKDDFNKHLKKFEISKTKRK